MRFPALRALFGQATTPAIAAPENVTERLLKDRLIFLGTPIDDTAANDVIVKLLFLEKQSTRQPIRLLINSPGGLVLAGLAILDTMDQVRAPVATHCMGTAHSMAAVILAYGRANSRTAEANSSIMFTLPRAPEDADEQKMQDAVRLGEILISKTATAAKRPIAEIRELFEQGTALSAPNAVAAGIIDRVTAAPR